MEEEWTWNISSNYIIKSDVCRKLKYIQISLDIYELITYHAESKERKKLTYQLCKHNEVTPWSFIIIKFIWTILY